MYKKDLKIGDKFGEWTVIGFTNQKKHGHQVYVVKCSCGTTTQHAGYYLRSIKSPYCRSCSAKRKFLKGEECHSYKHGATLKGNPLRDTYKVWVSMRQRCRDKNSRDYKNYGGRGISVCDEWDTFEKFLEDMGKCPKGLSLDRVDNNGNYNKENCKWVTRKEQNNNRRDNTFFIIEGKRVTRTQLQETLGITRDMYRRRSESKGIEWLIQEYKNKIKGQ